MSYKNKQAVPLYGKANKEEKFTFKVKNGDDVLIKENRQDFPLERKNFQIMALAAAMIVIGFLLMLGGSSTESEFNPDIFSTRRIVVGPTIAFIGFLLMGFAVIYLPGKRRNNVQSGNTDEVELK